MAIQYAQEKEASRSMSKVNNSSKKGLNEIARIDFGLEGATDHVN
jgi:hypothetical protein